MEVLILRLTAEDTGVVEVLVEAGVLEDTILGLVLAPGLGLGRVLTHAQGPGPGRLPTLPGKGFGLPRNLTQPLMSCDF